MWESFSSACLGIVEKRLGLNLHHGAVNSVDALQLKGSSATENSRRLVNRSMHQASESI